MRDRGVSVSREGEEERWRGTSWHRGQRLQARRGRSEGALKQEGKGAESMEEKGNGVAVGARRRMARANDGAWDGLLLSSVHRIHGE